MGSNAPSRATRIPQPDLVKQVRVKVRERVLAAVAPGHLERFTLPRVNSADCAVDSLVAISHPETIADSELLHPSLFFALALVCGVKRIMKPGGDPRDHGEGHQPKCDAHATEYCNSDWRTQHAERVAHIGPQLSTSRIEGENHDRDHQQARPYNGSLGCEHWDD